MGEQTYGEVLDELRALRAEVAELRARTEPTPPAQASEAEVRSPGRPLDRRMALRAGLIAAGGAAVAVATGAQPAAAANGNSIVLGSQTNTSTGATITSVDAASPTVGFGVWDVSRAALLPSSFPAIAGHAKGSSFNTGVEGYGENVYTGVHGVSDAGWGVHGLGNTGEGVGVVGSSVGTGVYGASQEGIGVLALTYGSTAIVARALGSGTGSGTGTVTSGRAANLRFDLPFDGVARNAPTSDSIAHQRGEVVYDSNGDLWYCTANGTPGTWRKLAGASAAGAFHVLPTPVRVYDSRPGTSPAGGTKSKLVPNVNRTIDLKNNSSGVAAGATAALVTIILVNAAAGNGYMSIWANGATRPQANALVWGGSTGRFTTTAVTALDAARQVQVFANLATDIVVDVVGYYR